jgi:MFS family permease
MYLVGLGLYIIGASIAGGKVHMDALIGARVIQGIGAAGMFSMSAIVVVEMTQPRQRAAWTSLTQAGGALGNICGPLFAGAMFLRGWSWNSIFAVEVGVASLLFGFLMTLLPWDNRSVKERLRELKDCDWSGMALFFVCAVGILVPINIGGTSSSLGWGSIPVLTTLAGGVIFLVALICHQRRLLAKRPAFPREVFARRTTTGIPFPLNIFASVATSIAFLGSAVCGILLFMVFYSLVIFWEGIRRKSTVGVGLVLLSVTLTYPVAFALTGMAIKKWGRVRYAIATGVFLSTLGLGLMQLMTEDAHECCLILICVIAGAGCGVLGPAMVNAVLATTDSRWHPHAIAIRTILYTAGQCIGVSLGMAIFTGAFKARFEAQDGDAALRANVAHMALENPQELISKISELRELAPDGELVSMVVGALRWVWGFACVFAALTGALAILMNCPDLAPDSKTQTVPPDEEQQRNGTEMASR